MCENGLQVELETTSQGWFYQGFRIVGVLKHAESFMAEKTLNIIYTGFMEPYSEIAALFGAIFIQLKPISSKIPEP